jgi:protein TonB
MTTHRFAASFIAIPLPQASLHFLMSRIDFRLFAALVLSLSLHLLPLLQNFNFDQKLPSTAAMLKAELRQPTPPPAPAAMPPLDLPKPRSTPENAPKPTPPSKPQSRPAPSPPTWTQAVREHLKKLDNAGQFYPAQAIAQGLEGEVQVLLIINESGTVSAARVEQSSGHAILDEAALRAVRSLRSLPADAPREVVLPVRFRLR